MGRGVRADAAEIVPFDGVPELLADLRGQGSGGFGEAELRDAGARGVYESIAELRDSLGRVLA